MQPFAPNPRTQWYLVQPKVRGFGRLGEPVSVGTRLEEFAGFMQSEMAIYGKAIKDTGTKVE